MPPVIALTVGNGFTTYVKILDAAEQTTEFNVKVAILLNNIVTCVVVAVMFTGLKVPAGGVPSPIAVTQLFPPSVLCSHVYTKLPEPVAGLEFTVWVGSKEPQPGSC